MPTTILLSAPYMIPVYERLRPVFAAYDLEVILPPVTERLEEEDLLAYAGRFDGAICGDDRFTIGFRDNLAVVETDDTIFELPQAISADGARFASEDGRNAFWGKGDQAMLTLDGVTYPECEMVEDEIDEILLGLHSRAMVSQVYGAGSRAGKWRQELTSMLELDGPMMAVLGELFLRGPQTLGELRTRASRMKPIADLAMLEGVLALMAAHSPTLAMRLTPQGVRRGVRWCHCLQSEALLSQLRLAEESGVDASPSSAASPRRSSGRLEEMAEEIEILRKRVDNLEKSLGVIPATSGETSP